MITKNFIGSNSETTILGQWIILHPTTWSDLFNLYLENTYQDDSGWAHLKLERCMDVFKQYIEDNILSNISSYNQEYFANSLIRNSLSKIHWNEIISIFWNNGDEK